MQLNHLSINHYKNIREADLQFSPSVNCIVGHNGMGKTNLLDAIYYLSFCKSFGGMTDSELITEGEDYFTMEGDYAFENEDNELIRAGYKRGRKSFKRSGKEYQRLSEHIGLLPLVLLTPADSILLTGGSEERRDFMDKVICQYNKSYLAALIRYNQALKQRNFLLKDAAAGTAVDPLLFSACEQQMDYFGQQIYQCRAQFVMLFTPVFQEFYAEVSGQHEVVSLEYTSHFSQGESLLPLLNAVRGRDLALGYTTRGSHKDDLHFLLGGHPIRYWGSQGQNKTLLVSLKLAQFDLLRREREAAPLLLLDDIFDRLDGARVAHIIQLVSQQQRFGQIFITDTNRENLDQITARMAGDYCLFHAESGSFSTLQA